MIPSFPNRIINWFLLYAAVILIPTSIAAETRPYRVAVVPFSINAEKDLTYLKNGIADMLTSRLAWADKVQVLGREQTVSAMNQGTGPLNEIQAQMLGATLGADYVLFGSLTIFGNSVSMDAKMVDVSGERQTLSFFNQAEGMGKVIPQINRFATNINAQVFGRQAATPVALAAAAPGTGRPAATPQQDIHAHPEKLLEGGGTAAAATAATAGPFVTSQAPAQTQSSLNPAFIATAGANAQTSEFWKSATFKHLISGIEIGDINGDKILETVVATSEKVIVYQGVNNKFRKIYEHGTGRYSKNISVDIADLNGNGYPEIFISGLSNQLNGVNSTVIEFNGQSFQILVEKSRWLFRVADNALRGRVLLGQRIKSERIDPFAGEIFELAWEGNELAANDRLLPSGKANVLGVAYSDILNDGDEAIAAYTKSDKLQVLNRSGKSQWSSGETTGGNLQHLKMPTTGRGDAGLNLFYLPTRIRVMDLDGDGKYEVIQINNFDVAGGKLEQFRSYKNGQMESHVWNGLGLTPLWKTRKISGRIQDFAIGDFDGDGRQELVAAIIMSEGRIVGTSPKSSVIAYELNQ